MPRVVGCHIRHRSPSKEDGLGARVDTGTRDSAASPAGLIRFVWIGDGKHRARYEAVLADMGLRDRVTLLGLLPPEEVARQLCGFDIIVHASRWEGLPRALVQALLTEVPAVSFDNDGAPEVVIDNQTGLLIPYGDTDALAEAVIRLVPDSALRRRLGQAGRKRCLSMFDWRTMVNEIEAEYLRLAAPDPWSRRIGES